MRYSAFIIQLMRTALHSALTITIEVISLISPTSGFVGVVGGNVAASTVLCQEVSQSEGLALFFSFLTYKHKTET